jgi:hypothetical protein
MVRGQTESIDKSTLGLLVSQELFVPEASTQIHIHNGTAPWRRIIFVPGPLIRTGQTT